MPKWTDDEVSFLVENYPKKGIDWCCEKLRKTRPQIRMKASRLGLRARGHSDAWHANNAAHSIRMTGRKRPEQAEVMRRNHREGKFKRDERQRKAVGKRMRAWIAENGHPRGMLGKKHSRKTKDVIGEKSREHYAGLNDEEKALLVLKNQKTRVRNGTLYPKRPHGSWKAGWRTVGGKRCYFRSRWEANYARYLEFLRHQGQVIEWEHEPETFWFEGVKRGAVSYLPDFRVKLSNSAIEYHEVKGWMDSRSKTKIRRMKKYHPGVVLVVIDQKPYREIETKLGRMLDGWEFKE